MGFPQARILEWVAFPPPGDRPEPGIEPTSPALAGRFFTPEPPGKPQGKLYQYIFPHNATKLNDISKINERSFGPNSDLLYSLGGKQCRVWIVTPSLLLCDLSNLLNLSEPWTLHLKM